jgi:uncharacterized protein
MVSLAPSPIGQGIAFPFTTTLQGNLTLSQDHRNLQESIRIILQTNLGERLYRPDFGSRLAELVFAPMNSETLMLVRMYTEEAIVKWEPRVILDRITTEPDPRSGCIQVTLHYHAKDNPDPKSMVCPFYLVPPGQ